MDGNIHRANKQTNQKQILLLLCLLPRFKLFFSFLSNVFINILAWFENGLKWKHMPIIVCVSVFLCFLCFCVVHDTRRLLKEKKKNSKEYCLDMFYSNRNVDFFFAHTHTHRQNVFSFIDIIFNYLLHYNEQPDRGYMVKKGISSNKILDTIWFDVCKRKWTTETKYSMRVCGGG